MYIFTREYMGLEGYNPIESRLGLELINPNTVPSTSCKALVNPRLDNQIPTQKSFPKLSMSCMVRTMSPSSGGLGGRSNTPLNSSTRGAPVTVVGEAAQSITTVAVRFADTGRGRWGLVRVNGESGAYFSI